jgi:hypothetical protein
MRLGHEPAPGDGAAWVIDQVAVAHRPQRPRQLRAPTVLSGAPPTALPKAAALSG